MMASRIVRAGHHTRGARVRGLAFLGRARDDAAPGRSRRALRARVAPPPPPALGNFYPNTKKGHCDDQKFYYQGCEVSNLRVENKICESGPTWPKEDCMIDKFYDGKRWIAFQDDSTLFLTWDPPPASCEDMEFIVSLEEVDPGIQAEICSIIA